MNKNDDSSSSWGQYLLILFFVAIIGFIVWQRWIKPSQIEIQPVAAHRERISTAQSSPRTVAHVVSEVTLKNEVKNDERDAIPLVERDPGLLDRQSERLRKESEAARESVERGERGPRASVLSEKQIQALERKGAILQ